MAKASGRDSPAEREGGNAAKRKVATAGPTQRRVTARPAILVTNANTRKCSNKRRTGKLARLERVDQGTGCGLWKSEQALSWGDVEDERGGKEKENNSAKRRGLMTEARDEKGGAFTKSAHMSANCGFW